MTQLAIIADDLSSATDCGAQVARSGQPVVVPLSGYALPAQAGNASVISIDTNSRSVSAEQAYATVKEAATSLAAAGWQHFYKSVDSTLRGNLGAEIDAVMDVTHPDCAIVAPAFPKYGRTTRSGVQYLHGKPLNQTEFGTDPTAPVREADITSLLWLQSKRKSGRITLSQLRSGPREVSTQLNRHIANGLELIIFDVMEQDDLRRICETVAASGVKALWVGSTGLSEFVPLALGLGRNAPSLKNRATSQTRCPALLVAGSASETTCQQIEHAQSAGLQLTTLHPAPIVSGGPAAEAEIARVLASLQTVIISGHNAGLAVLSTRADIADTQELGAALGLAPAQVAARIASALAAISRTLAIESSISGIVATGGDTAKAICDSLLAEALEIEGEIEAGIPLMRLLGPTTLPIVIKAGGFGSPQAITQAIEAIKHYA
jgi:D-threonate/D-erythronate kinase